ncbi:MAG: GNAT family N-acetyltransferase [Anaerolineaceae bacterium]|nr:GNAT family N-acetyltransferase [Anaerolineaceae bacterium]
MKSISPSGRAFAENLFRNSIYQNTHLGWLELWDLPSAGGNILIDRDNGRNFLIAIQPAEKGTVWLHSFYADSEPGDYPLVKKIKELSHGPHISLYAISSHQWFAGLLEQNIFRKSDEIVELETAEIRQPVHLYSSRSHAFSYAVSEDIIREFEQAFPPLWRLNSAEIHCACETSSYKLVLKEERKNIGCLLADFADGNCHIQRISVLPEFRNQGAASLMIRQMIKDAEKSGINHFSVNTNKNNTAAMQLYKHMNFMTQVKSFPVYYRYI